MFVPQTVDTVFKRLLVGCAGLAMSLPGYSAAQEAPMAQSRAPVASIRVIEGGWGSANLEDIRQVLELVARQFPVVFDDRATPQIQVRHRFGAPRVFYDLSPTGEFVVELTARNERWYQYSYQFSHEYCHVLSGFERKERDAQIVRDNQWFEESLCEAASLYGLRRLALAWPQDPLSARFPGTARVIGQYAQELLTQPHRRLPQGVAFSAWFADHRVDLRDDPYQREQNELISSVLLSLFEREPNGWESLAYLNANAATQPRSFEAYLEAWHSAAPAALQPFVARIAETFGINAGAASDSAPASETKSPSIRSPGAEPASDN
jgi:hypothetical protein